MKRIRILGMALLTVLMSVSLSACVSNDNDDNNGGGTSATFEGTWHSMSEKWYPWDKENNQPDYSNYYIISGDTWIFKKDGDKYIWRYLYTDNGKDYEDNGELILNGKNDYIVTYNNKNDSRIVFKSISRNSLQFEYWDGYYREEGTAEYGIVNVTK